LKKDFPDLVFPESASYLETENDDIGQLLDIGLESTIVEERRKIL
jgi:hypothetical protein